MPDFTMPSLGADMDSGTLLEWLVAPGAVVHRGDPVAVVDTDKAAIEVESFHDGVVEDLLVEPGTRVAVGTPLARLGPSDGIPAPTTAPASPTAPDGVRAAGAPAPRPQPVPPPLRHYAADLGVDLATVHGTGPNGEIRRADVDAAASRLAAPLPLDRREGPPRRRVTPYARRLADELGVDLASLPDGDGTVRAADVRRAAGVGRARPERPAPVVRERDVGRATIAASMSRSKREIPHYYVGTTVDLQRTAEWLRTHNREHPVTERIVPAAAMLRAVALAAREVPEVNGFWKDAGFVPAGEVHLGVAVRIRGGPLVAPALRHADTLTLPELMAALRDLVQRAREGRFTRAELADPTITVTDLGDQGVEEVYGVIHPPQVALVGVGRIVERPWAIDGMLAVRPVVRLTLSGDHRATDGTTGARFLAAVDQLLQRPEAL
jgi:pyruvate dehydrogenase E2 component (dihydrolipoamide acetyltransferase)